MVMNKVNIKLRQYDYESKGEIVHECMFLSFHVSEAKQAIYSLGVPRHRPQKGHT